MVADAEHTDGREVASGDVGEDGGGSGVVWLVEFGFGSGSLRQRQSWRYRWRRCRRD